MSDPVLIRWDAFKEQILLRFQQIMTEAREGCAALLLESDGNSIAMSNAWGAMEIRAKELRSKVSDTWGNQVEPKLEQSGAGHDVVTREREKVDAFGEWLDEEIEKTRIAVFADAARWMMDRARGDAGAELRCTQCGAALEVPFGFRAVNVSCQHCGTVSTYEPGMRVRMVEAMGVHPLCEEHAWEQRLAWRRAEREWRRARPETITVLEALEKAQLAYWDAYLGFRARLLPETAAAFAKDREGKMRQWYESLRHNKAWVEAGRARG